ncbi:unnamed protein product [Durusdinium trenchii]|uniref:Secreted protein n=1 Tax=Durusdinium trenchii TaxID=1381693 RepID=A0ABP0P1Y5_9DINO
MMGSALSSLPNCCFAFSLNQGHFTAMCPIGSMLSWPLRGSWISSSPSPYRRPPPRRVSWIVLFVCLLRIPEMDGDCWE